MYFTVLNALRYLIVYSVVSCLIYYGLNYCEPDVVLSCLVSITGLRVYVRLDN